MKERKKCFFIANIDPSFVFIFSFRQIDNGCYILAYRTDKERFWFFSRFKRITGYRGWISVDAHDDELMMLMMMMRMDGFHETSKRMW